MGPWARRQARLALFAAALDRDVAGVAKLLDDHLPEYPQIIHARQWIRCLGREPRAGLPTVFQFGVNNHRSLRLDLLEAVVHTRANPELVQLLLAHGAPITIRAVARAMHELEIMIQDRALEQGLVGPLGFEYCANALDTCLILAQAGACEWVIPPLVRDRRATGQVIAADRVNPLPFREAILRAAEIGWPKSVMENPRNRDILVYPAARMSWLAGVQERAEIHHATVEAGAPGLRTARL